jgi:histidinol-phosphate aminotransferase
LVDLDFIEEVLKANQDVIVIIDEAYIDFGGKTAKPLLEKYENLLVVQTYSKSRSLAGLRIGYAMGNPELIKALNDVKYSFNSYTMNQPSIAIGAAILEDEEYFVETTNKIIATREWFKEEMTRLGFSFEDSKSNFLFVTHESANAKDIFEAAKKADIFVRYFNKPRIDNYLRITVGTDEEMKKFVKFIEEFLNNSK